MFVQEFIPTVPKKEELFDDYKRDFLWAQRLYGDDAAYEFMHVLFSVRLADAYGTDFKKGNPRDFIRVVGERDKSVGLHVRFKLSDDQSSITYQFVTDPFSNLSGRVDPERFYGAFMDFKVEYLLGTEWSYKMTRHHHRNEGITEFVITKED